ncbi:MAG: antitoxin Xre/MbcA/ParS toxin-binding domain-containing protein [Pseudomonadota bacterium]
MGSTSATKRWLIRPLRSLGGFTPLPLFDTSAGIELVH